MLWEESLDVVGFVVLLVESVWRINLIVWSVTIASVGVTVVVVSEMVDAVAAPNSTTLNVVQSATTAVMTEMVGAVAANAVGEAATGNCHGRTRVY